MDEPTVESTVESTVEAPPEPAPSDEGPSGDSAADSARSRPGWLPFVPIAALILVLAVVPTPYFVISPGEAQDVIPLIKISGHPTFEPTGHLLLTAVDFRRANVFEALLAKVLPHHELFPERAFEAPGQTDQQQQQVALSQMDTSKIDAAVVALSRWAGYPKEHGPGALIEGVFAGSPAAGKLFAGDVITKVDSTTITSVEQLSAVIKAAGKGHALTFTVQAAGTTRTATAAPAQVTLPDGHRYVGVGIAPVANFPFPLTISSGNIGGPSAGLMWAIGLSDWLTNGDLTGGHAIAGTGEIGPDGTVYPIGGVREKVVAAEDAGATVFILPAQDAPDARRAGTHLTLVPVHNYGQALSWLLSHGGKASLQ